MGRRTVAPPPDPPTLLNRRGTQHPDVELVRPLAGAQVARSPGLADDPLPRAAALVTNRDRRGRPGGWTWARAKRPRRPGEFRDCAVARAWPLACDGERVKSSSAANRRSRKGARHDVRLRAGPRRSRGHRQPRVRRGPLALKRTRTRRTEGKRHGHRLPVHLPGEGHGVPPRHRVPPPLHPVLAVRPGREAGAGAGPRGVGRGEQPPPPPRPTPARRAPRRAPGWFQVPARRAPPPRPHLGAARGRRPRGGGRRRLRPQARRRRAASSSPASASTCAGRAGPRDRRRREERPDALAGGRHRRRGEHRGEGAARRPRRPVRRELALQGEGAAARREPPPAPCASGPARRFMEDAEASRSRCGSPRSSASSCRTAAPRSTASPARSPATAGTRPPGSSS